MENPYICNGRAGIVAALLRGLAAFVVVLGCAGHGGSGVSAQEIETAIVLNSEEASVSVVDRKAMVQTHKFTVGREPHHIILTPDGRDLVLASTVTNELLFLDPATGIERRRIRNIVDPYQLGYSPDGKWFVTAAFRLHHVDIYEAKDFRLAKRIFIQSLPSHMAFDKASKTVFVTLQGTNSIVAYDLATQAELWTAPVGEAPAGILVLPDQKSLLVGLTGEDAAVVVDIEKRAVTKRIPTGRGAHNIFPMPGGKRILITNRIENTISAIDLATLSVVDTFHVSGGPDDLDFTPDGKQFWVTQRFRRKVAAVDMATRQVLGTVAVGRSPHGIFINGPHTVLRTVEPPAPAGKRP